MALSLVPRALIGVIHLPALPSSPANTMAFEALIEHALTDARTLKAGGADACIIENFGDAPFRKGRVDPHVPTVIGLIAHQIRQETELIVGINILRNDAHSALGAAAAVGADFIRVNIHSGAALTDQGVIEGQADNTLRYRRALNASVAIAADIDVKHAKALAERPLSEVAQETYTRAGADILIVSGTGTGSATSVEDLKTAREAVPHAPLWLGSGLTLENMSHYRNLCDAFIVGTALHQRRDLSKPLDTDQVKRFKDALKS